MTNIGKHNKRCYNLICIYKYHTHKYVDLQCTETLHYLHIAMEASQKLDYLESCREYQIMFLSHTKALFSKYGVSHRFCISNKILCASTVYFKLFIVKKEVKSWLHIFLFLITRNYQKELEGGGIHP